MTPARLLLLCRITACVAFAVSAATLAQTPNSAIPPASPAAQAEGEIAVLVQAGQETTLSSQMAGRVSRIRVGLGDTVRAGARLIDFDCSEQRAELEAAQAEYRGARENHLARIRLQALGAAGELEVTLAATAADKARSQSALRASQLRYCTINAPFPGKITRLHVKTAESVPLGSPLLEMVNPVSLKAQLFVPVSWVDKLKPNTPFEVRITETGRSYQARVAKLNARIEGVSQQLEIEARFDGNRTGLLPGMVGTAHFADPPTP
jgi:membrane fusion protein, multidrug efflux system